MRAAPAYQEYAAAMLADARYRLMTLARLLALAATSELLAGGLPA
jgi:hypothetical protein